MSKPLRDWMTDRHQGAVPALDELRRAALPPERIELGRLIHELFWPQRRVWLALAAIWLALGALQVAVIHSAPEVRDGTTITPAMLAELGLAPNSHELLFQIGAGH